MATQGWGRCNRCGAVHKSIMFRGPCESCLEKDRQRAAHDRQATVEKLRRHPDLAEVEHQMSESWDTLWDDQLHD